MKEWPAPAQDRRDITKDPHEKAVYSSPVLRLYGSVRKLTRGTATVGNDGTNSRKNSQSDRATKENIVRIDTHPLRIGLYLFDYKPEFQEDCGHGRQFGVMADEVEAVLPDAVSMHANGYKMVDYAMLGITHPHH
jgi:hypothetical protein